MVQLPRWEFDLYIAGDTTKAHSVYANLEKFCAEHLKGDCKITIYDLLANPKLAIENQITATPMAIRRSPLPQRTLIGDLSNTDSMATRLGLK